MSTLRYDGKLVCCCCSNCMNAVDYKRQGLDEVVRCKLDDRYNHPLHECESYQFSAWRFEHNGPQEAGKGGAE